MSSSVAVCLKANLADYPVTMAMKDGRRGRALARSRAGTLNWLLLALWPIILAALSKGARTEEEMLRRKFGSAYDAYPLRKVGSFQSSDRG